MRRKSGIVEERLKSSIASWQKKMQPYSGLVQAFDGEFWAIVVERLKNTAANIAEDRENNYQKMTETELKVSIAKEVTLKETMRLPNRDRAIQLKYAERIAMEREKLRNYKKNRED